MDAYPPSLLDKLLGSAPNARDGTLRRFSFEQVKNSVARDIEMLLNAHPMFSVRELSGLPNAARSSLTIGLVDISSMSLASDPDRLRISNAIRDGLMAHDPRLSDVEVGVRQLGSSAQLSFTIRARLNLKPQAERVVFDAVLQPGSKRYDVSEPVPRPASPAG